METKITIEIEIEKILAHIDVYTKVLQLLKREKFWTRSRSGLCNYIRCARAELFDYKDPKNFYSYIHNLRSFANGNGANLSNIYWWPLTWFGYRKRKKTLRDAIKYYVNLLDHAEELS